MKSVIPLLQTSALEYKQFKLNMKSLLTSPEAFIRRQVRIKVDSISLMASILKMVGITHSSPNKLKSWSGLNVICK